ncbi:putative transcriptional regulator [Burkholderia cenocepacia H111]|nr:putative transcriptional regulator [Burkholderia cenocepacia H111]
MAPFSSMEERRFAFCRALLATQQPEPRDAIARSKRILGFVDEYHENPTRDTRTALRVALMDEFQPEPRDEVTDAPRTERRHWNPVYNTDPVQRACTELPEGWGVNACMERDAGWVEVYGPNGEEPDFESDASHFDWRIHEAIDFAIEAAGKGDAS